MRAWEGAEARCPWSESRQQAAIGPEGKRGSKCIWRHGRAGPWGTGRERGGFQGQHRDVRPPGAVLGHERAGAVGAHQGEARRLRQHHLHVRSPPASMVRRLSQRPSSFSAPSAHPPGCDESAIGAVYWKNPAAPEVGARAKCTSGQRIRSAASTAVSPPDTFVSVRRSLAGPHNSRSVLALQF